MMIERTALAMFTSNLELVICIGRECTSRTVSREPRAFPRARVIGFLVCIVIVDDLILATFVTLSLSRVGAGASGRVISRI